MADIEDLSGAARHSAAAATTSAPPPAAVAPAAAPVRRGASCAGCGAARPVLKRPSTGLLLCRDCFLRAFEDDVHATITQFNLFRRGQRVAIGASGGKDSTVLAHVLHTLNARHNYGVELLLLSVDEGIRGYRDDSLDAVRRNAASAGLPLHIVAYRDLYAGWSMDAVVDTVGRKSNCTYCGVFRRQALDRGAAAIRADVVATGHTADDIAETVLMNLLRGDIARLGRCTGAVTGAEGDLPRVKPLRSCYEREVVLYAYHARLDYHSTECIYSPGAYRGFAREFLKNIERVRPAAILDVLRGADWWQREPLGFSPAGGEGVGVGVVAASEDAGSGAAGAAASGGCGGSGECSGSGEGCGRSGVGSASAGCGCSSGSGGCGCKEPAPALTAPAPAAPTTSEPMRIRREMRVPTARAQVRGTCVRCGYMTSAAPARGGGGKEGGAGGEDGAASVTASSVSAGLCKACLLLDTLESSKVLKALGRTGSSSEAP